MLIMFVSVTILSLFIQIDSGVSVRGCLPNSKFYVNGKFCQCDRTGRWDENSCSYLTHQSNCRYGQIIWRGCMRCVCQMNGELACSNHNCSETKSNIRPLARSGNRSVMKLFSSYGPRCSPLTSFSIDCQMCICPASGRTLDIRCILKPACLPEKVLSLSDIRASDKRFCLPNVIYVFQCLHCLCSEQGQFTKEKCIDMCKANDIVLSKCKPQSFYKNQCNVCYCPNDGIPNSKLCTNASCSGLKLNNYSTFVSMQCIPYTFTKKKCIYCDCNEDGSVNEDDCLEAPCLPSHPTYHTMKYTCSPGEIVQICAECICPVNGHTLEKFCTKTCDNQSKNAVLENILTNDTNDLIDLKEIPNECLENSMCVENGKLCFSFNSNTKLCTAQVVNLTMSRKRVGNIRGHGSDVMNMSASCEPNTFVDFDCNTCFCSKFGTIDPKWCTYDNCEKKKYIQRSNSCERHPDTCQPGSITQENCSFCICPKSGISRERKCTVSNNHTNECTTETFLCEPLSYYVVDCNVCYCPHDGFKNVAQCTKKNCEKNFLKTRTCIPGQLFSEECNICICPSNGIKSNEACTNRSCSEFANRKIFDTRNPDGNEIKDEPQPLGHCFPGEEFEVGCKLCICPDMGLREFAACVPEICPEEEDHNYNIRRNSMDPIDTSSIIESIDTFSVLPLHRRTIMESCKTYNLTLSPERIECTPGTMYFIRCRICICPYMDNINNFCRPLPDGVYCEQAYPNFNFLPMGRRNNTLREANKKTQEFQGQPVMETTNIITEHFHTKYNCTKQGFLLDACFICECDENYFVIEEHCFKSDAKECIDVKKPMFLGDA